MAPKRELITTGKAAERFGVSAMTMRRWANDGLVPSVKLPSGQLRFDAAVIDELATAQASA